MDFDFIPDGYNEQQDLDFDDTTRSSAGVPTADDNDNGGDLFTSTGRKPAECVCPNCQRNMAASRFAPHLEKCMGMGRNSSRLASRRIATATREAAMASDDDGDDDEWAGAGSAVNDRKRRNKKDKNSPRRKRLKNGETSAGSTTAAAAAAGAGGAAEIAAQGDVAGMELLPLRDRRNIFSTMCGVVSEHTGKMCTKTLRCPQHTEAQRREVRDLMLSENNDVAVNDNGDKDRDIDVDTWEEGDSLASLLTVQASQTADASPAESTSTSTSSSSTSKKNTKQSKAKKKSTRDIA